MDISFELWLFTFKKLGQTYDSALSAFERLSADRKEALKNEYEQFKNK